MSAAGKYAILRKNEDVGHAARLIKSVGDHHPAIWGPCERILRLARDPVTAVVLGEFSAGKSSFLNRLLETNLLPVSVLPSTATVTRIAYGQDRTVVVEYGSGDNETIPYDEYVRLQQAAKLQEPAVLDRVRRIREARISLDRPVLQHFHLVDTPGFNHDAVMDEKTLEVLGQADIVFWIADYTAVAKESEAGILERIRGRGIPAWLVVNKGDLQVGSSDAHAKAAAKLARYLAQIGFLDYFQSREVFLVSSTATDPLWDGIFAQFQARLGAMVLQQDMNLSVELISAEWQRLCLAFKAEVDWSVELSSACDALDGLLDANALGAIAKREIFKNCKHQFIQLLSDIVAYAGKVEALPESGIPAVKALAMACTRDPVDKSREALERACARVLRSHQVDHLHTISEVLGKALQLVPDGQAPLRTLIEVLLAYCRLQEQRLRSTDPPQSRIYLPAVSRVTEVITHISIQFGNFAFSFADQIEELGVLSINQTAAALNIYFYRKIQLESALASDIEREIQSMCGDPLLAAMAQQLRNLANEATERLASAKKHLGHLG